MGRCLDCAYCEKGCKHSAPYFCFKPKEKPMTDKIPQMTEEQAKEILEIICLHTDVNKKVSLDKENTLENFKICGYIRKSELETLVEEAEEQYKEYCKITYERESPLFMDKMIHGFHNIIQALKSTHQEFKKC